MALETFLPLAWAMLIALAVFLYVCLDGFDLGIGILFPLFDAREERDTMVNSVAPFWDGNETWLVLGGGGLLAVFPLAYATILPALYMPIILMLLALVFRGVAFEMRFRAGSERQQRWWDRAFGGGSFGAAICQGIALGAFVQGIAVEGRSYAGGWWDWLTPFSLLTAAALVAGYALLGACWLVWKTEHGLQRAARAHALPLAAAVLGFLAAVSIATPALQPAYAARWLDASALPLAGALAAIVALLGWRLLAVLRDAEYAPETAWLGDAAAFVLALALFVVAYVALALTLWPLAVPPAITIWEAAAPPSTQLFLLVGAALLLPMILAYTGYVYWVFRGKVRRGEGYH